ncbi:MAG: hypothetical protein M1536_00295 [Firmicutes bacterium]|nr:hypothetical protein [Bacillota bacterium]
MERKILVRFSRTLIVLIFVMLFFVSSVYGRDEILPLKYVKPGMKGYGKSVFKGTTVETFPITVIGIMKKRIGESDMILIRIDGGYVTRHNTGVIGGMSGSPVYINGKVIGAIAYGWGFPKEPIAGVTPIESMLKSLPLKYKKSALEYSKDPHLLSNPVQISGKKYSKVKILEKPPVNQKFIEPGTMVMTPLHSTFQVRGLSERTLKKISSRWESFNFMPVESFSGGNVPAKAPYLVPGSAVGLQLLKGDIDISVTGTLTYRDGNTFLAFGHPFELIGNSSLPLTAAYIDAVFSSYERSFKLASPIAVVGTISEDRLWAVSGTIGKIPPMIPVNISIVDEERGLKKAFHFKAVNDPNLTILAVSAALMESLGSTAGVGAQSTATIDYHFYPKNLKDFHFTDAVFGSSIDALAGLQLSKYLEIFYLNDFQQIDLSKVDMVVHLNSERKTAAIGKIYAEKANLKPGEPLELGIEIKPYGGKPQIKKIKVALPPDISFGGIKVGVSGGSEAFLMKKRLFINEPNPTNILQVMKDLKEKEKNNQIVVKIILPRNGATVADEQFYFLPPSMIDILSRTSYSDIFIERDVITRTFETPYFVHGFDFMWVLVEKEKKEESKKNPSGSDFASSGNDKKIKLQAESPSVQPSEEEGTGAAKEDMKKPVPQTITEKASISATKRWDSLNFHDFEKGAFTNISCTSDGILSLAPASTILHETNEPFIWSLACDSQGNIYAGTGNSGKILKISPSGKSEIFASTGETFVNSLAADENGNIYAGTSPHGKVFKINPAGKVSLIFETSENYIWCVKLKDGNLWAATGNPGRIYRIDPSGKANLFFDSGEMHIRSFDFDAQGNIIAGTGNNGIIFKVTPDGKGISLATCMDVSVDSVLTDREDVIWAASGNSIYRIKNGILKKTGLDEDLVTFLAPGANGEIYAATGHHGRLYKLEPSGKITMLYSSGYGQILSILKTGNGELYFSSAAPAKVLKMTGEPSNEGIYESAVFDAKSFSRWGNIRWDSVSGKTSRISIYTRSGDTPTPDEKWSPWQGEYSDPSGQQVLSPSGRFIQYRINMKSGDITPLLNGISIFFKNAGSAPDVTLIFPAGQEMLSGRLPIRWKLEDVAIEDFAADLYYSSDEGKTWNVLKKFAPLSTDTSGLQKQAPSASEQTFLWDTKSVKDGTYQIKVVSFPRANPADKFSTTEAISKTFTICNTSPELLFLGEETKEGFTTLKGIAKSALVNIYQVSFRVDRGEWQPAVSSDGFFDSPREEFLIILPSSGRHTIEIKAQDEAGNTTCIKREI